MNFETSKIPFSKTLGLLSPQFRKTNPANLHKLDFDQVEELHIGFLSKIYGHRKRILSKWAHYFKTLLVSARAGPLSFGYNAAFFNACKNKSFFSSQFPLWSNKSWWGNFTAYQILRGALGKATSLKKKLPKKAIFFLRGRSNVLQ